MLTLRGSSNKVLCIMFTISDTASFNLRTHILFVQINVLPTVGKSSHSACTVRDEDNATVKEETSLCSVSLKLLFLYVSSYILL